jgi:hypothetical protein
LVTCVSGSGIATWSSIHGEARFITAVCVANLLLRHAVEAAQVVKPDSFLVAPSKIKLACITSHVEHARLTLADIPTSFQTQAIDGVLPLFIPLRRVGLA